ncbi:MAG: phosphatidate cytidylyltransferase [Spirochaetaceae bacterium]|nr:MAG: phosphatidate cytidylyltransferase [Spirochaetaceae bacterium]
MRTATVVVALPVFFILIFLLPHYHHLALNVGAVLVAAVGARELQRLLAKRGMPAYPLVFLLAALIPALAYLEVLGLVSAVWSLGVPTALIMLVLLRSLWVRESKELGDLLQRISTSLLVLIYPALLLSFIVRLSVFENPRWVLLLFFSMNFANDIVAYLAGMFLGRSTRLGLLLSPNKSAVGFGGGVMAAVGIALLFKSLIPELLPISHGATVGFGAAVGIFTIAGDLVESAFKRSADVKDSGEIIPGRGGILDSIDSWLLTAPLFYFVFLWISR